MLVRVTRVPGVRGVLRLSRPLHAPRAPLAPQCARCFFRGPPGRNDPFLKMEEFMKDMERKFKRDVEDTIAAFNKEVGPGLVPRAWSVASPRPRFGDVQDVSTDTMYRLAFCFPKAKPEDVSVTLKDKCLTVEAKLEVVTEVSRSSQSFSMQYELPDGLDLNTLESTMSDDGVLTIEAPLPVSEPEAKGPQPINIKRE